MPMAGSGGKMVEKKYRPAKEKRTGNFTALHKHNKIMLHKARKKLKNM
jgi:hypothetical protein